MRKIIFLILLASCLVSCIGKKELGETFIKVENGYFTKMVYLITILVLITGMVQF